MLVWWITGVGCKWSNWMQHHQRLVVPMHVISTQATVNRHVTCRIGIFRCACQCELQCAAQVRPEFLVYAAVLALAASLQQAAASPSITTDVTEFNTHAQVLSTLPVVVPSTASYELQHACMSVCSGSL